MKHVIVASLAAVVLGSSAAVIVRGMPGDLPSASTADAQAGTAAPKSDELDRLLGPIALYPDALLGQMLLCATNPATVGALNEWLQSRGTLKGTDLQDAAKASGFSESYVAIVLFPDVVSTMAEQLDWTTKVGKAFTADKSAVFASIQRLRSKARDAGKLKTSAQQEVETRTTSSGQQVIVIEPANPQIVYVPQYNAQTVYVPTTTSSTVVIEDDDDSAEAVAAGLIGFTAGVAMGAAMDNNYYYGPYGWHGGVYMYDDAWDDWYDHREDAREDWADHREDIMEERGDRAENYQEQRTDRQQNRQETRPDAQGQRTERQQTRQEGRTGTQAASATATGTARSSAEARGYSGSDGSGNRPTASERSGTRSDAFSGYSSGKSERAASSRGQRSRSSARSGGGRRR